MGDLKTPWSNPVYPDTSDLGGSGVISRGSDPNADGGKDGEAGIRNFWDDPKQAMGENPSTEESKNSVSGLPALPNRFEPAESNIENVPDLTRRSPGTIDQK
jgi:hypothetical protein